MWPINDIAIFFGVLFKIITVEIIGGELMSKLFDM